MRSDRIVELEQALHRTWTRELLAVYAEELQQCGDPRGDIIALDLDVDAHGPSEELDAQRADALATWIGTEWDYDYRIATETYGFVGLAVSGCNRSDEGSDPLRTLFAAPFGGYVRDLRLMGTLAFLARGVERVAERTRPWLARLELHRAVLQGLPPERTSITSVEALVAATPYLTRLDVIGATAGPTSEGFVRPLGPVLDGLVHPTVRMLAVTGYDELRALARVDQPWPSVEHLDFAFGCESRFGDTSVGELAVVVAQAFPHLRSLDLSRNEPTPDGETWHVGSRHQAGELRVYDALAKLDLSRITALRLPSLRTDSNVVAIQAALDRMPQLATLEIARTYRSSPRPTLRHPTVNVVVPEASPWPACDQIPFDLDLLLGIADTDSMVTVPLPQAIGVMEATYRVLPASAQRAWDQIWPVIVELVSEPGATRRLPPDVVLRALDPLDDVVQDLRVTGGGLDGASHFLRERLRSGSADATLRLRSVGR